jgi:hypothetical protein
VGQLSFWSADARPRALHDLEGLLCGPGRIELFGRGSAARLVVALGPPPVREADEEGEDEGDPDDEATDEAGDEAGDEAADEAGELPGEEPGPALDPEELAFLDLDHDEIAARLGVRPASADRDRAPRAGGFPDTGRQHGRQADHHAGHHADPVTAWRARAVCCALGARGVPAKVGRAGDGRPEVRTAFRADLADLARAWTGGGGMKAVPAGFALDGPRLRLWVLAAGGREGRAYTLGLDPEARTLDDRLLTASHHLGLGATVGGDARAPVLRIVGARRQGRLAELVGRAPRAAVEGVWPV